MSMTVTTQPNPESQNDILGAILLAVNMLNRGSVLVTQSDTMLAMDQIKSAEELDLATTP